MPKKIIPIITGEKYHVFNRGTDKRNIFLDNFDYLRFYNSLAFFNTIEPVKNYRLAKGAYDKTSARLVNIIAYSLLPNHFHLILEPLVDNGISEFIKRISGGYTSYFNERNDRSGVLFQGKYKKVHISSNEQFQYLFAYVNENHSVHRIFFERQICHSSSLFYQGIAKSKLLNTKIEYFYNENIALAESIYKKRQQFKDTLE
jgi:putative transposase